MKRTAFVTCVQLGLSCIEEIYEIEGKVDLLITLEDGIDTDKSGRVYLDEISKEYNVPLLKIKNINDSKVVSALKEYDIDWLFIIGWSQIAKKTLLETPNLGSIGMHPTLLPEGRGRAAIPWAIIKGLNETGVTLFKLNEGVDTGEIIDQKSIKLTPNTTATSLYQDVNKLHVELIRDNWFSIIENTLSLSMQDENEATYWPGRKPKDGEITESMTMDEADKLIRATTKPYPGAFYRTEGNLYRIWSAVKSREHGEIKLRDGYLQLVDYEVEG